MNKRWVFGAVLGAAAVFGLSGSAQRMTTTIPSSTTMADGASPAGTKELPSFPGPGSDTKLAKVSRRHRHEAEKMFRAGAKAIQQSDPCAAQQYFLRAHELDPNNQRYLLLAEIARQSAVTQLVQRAEKERELGHKDKSLTAVEEAMRLDPQNPIVIEYVNTLAADAAAQLPQVRRGSDTAAGPIELAPSESRRSFHLRTDEQSLIRQVLNAYGIQAAMDASVKSQRVPFDADDVDFTEASDLVKLATNTFFVPLESQHVMVAADTKENRAKYERQVMETLYLPGLNASELNDMGNIARGVFGVEHAMVQPNQGTLTVSASEPELAALSQTFAELLAGRSEVQLEVRMYEIDKTKATNVGMILPASTTLFNVSSEVNSILTNNSSLVNQIIASDPALAGNYTAILAALIASGALTGTVFNSPFAVFGGGLTEMGLDLNGVSANMLVNSSDMRSLDQLQLRVLDQEEGTIQSGERYPIITSSYASLPASSSSTSSTTTVPQIQYQNLGLTLKVKPHVEGENEVSLDLDMKLDSLAGSTINNVPVLNNRQYTGVVSLRFGDSALIVSSMSQQDSLEITGVPGLSDIPGFQDTTNRQNTTDSMELAIMITPHLVRLAHRGTAEPMLLLPQH